MQQCVKEKWIKCYLAVSSLRMKNLKRIAFAILILLLPVLAFAQSIADEIVNTQLQLHKIDSQRQSLLLRLEDFKLQKIRYDLEKIGLPQLEQGDIEVKHSAYILGFVPKYKMARWVAHIIIPDVLTGVVFRTNDFREDSSIATGSAVEADYFVKELLEDSTYKYDGFGFDRGHLAPSADFRWSKKALSESYLYSNMSPQLAEFNRGSWGDLEDQIRGYMYRNPGTQLYMLTGPFMGDTLSKIERGKHKLIIPKRFWKVALDLKNKKAIGFIMPNTFITKPKKSLAVPVNEIQKQTGLNFFSHLPEAEQEELESQLKPNDWLPETNNADAEPLDQEKLPQGYFNTLVAKEWTNRRDEITVCGTVVGARVSKKGNILLNLDKQFPNQVFTVFIKKENIVNFNYKPEALLKGKIICVKGRVIDLSGVATMYIENENAIRIQD